MVTSYSTWKDFKGAAKRLEDLDIPRIGHRIGVGEDEIHAFMDVEAAGSGFDKQGRPKMLFEPHVFYRNLSGAKLAQAVKQGLAYKKWKKTGYPKDSYPRLFAAMKIDETAALKAASWGLGQVLGENFGLVGFGSPQEMVRSFMDDEENHLDAMVSFAIATGIDDDIRAHRWKTVARIYNGPGKVDEYAPLLEKAFNKWAKIKDTPWSPDAKAAPRAEVKNRVIDKKVVEAVQQLLRDKGFPEVGDVDGKPGERTETAIQSFQRYINVPETGVITDDLLAQLVRYEGRPQAPARANAKIEDIKGSEPVDIANTVKNVGVAVTGASGVGAVVKGADTWIEGLGKFKSLTDAVLQLSPWILGIAAGGVVIYFGMKLMRAQLAAYREGRLL